MTREIAEREGVLETMLERRKLEAENVMQLALALQTQTIEAAILWDTTVAIVNQTAGEEALRVVALAAAPETARSEITLGIIRPTDSRLSLSESNATSQRATLSQQVAQFLSAPDGGLRWLQAAGFDSRPSLRRK